MRYRKRDILETDGKRQRRTGSAKRNREREKKNRSAKKLGARNIRPKKEAQKRQREGPKKHVPSSVQW